MRVPAERGDRVAGRVEGLAAYRARVRNGFGALVGARRRAPAGVHVLEELDVVGGVHAQDRIETVRGRREDRPDPGGGDRGADALGAFRYLGRIDHAALVVERLARDGAGGARRRRT